MRRCAVLAVLLAAGAVAGPSGQRTEQRCAAYCLSPEDSKFSYTAGQTYVYSYSSDVETRMVGATDEASRLHVTATAEISANSACDFTLWLYDVTLSDSDPNNSERRQQVDDMSSFKHELERHPLSFSYQDGRVEELCSSQTESVWALNFKRGLLSATVNNLESLHRNETKKYEMDVSGYCSTDYTVKQTDNGTEVTKTKDLRTCRERGRLISSLQTTPYHSASKVQSMPLLKSTLQCRQTVSAGRLRSVVCKEDHLFRPFSREEYGVSAPGAVTRTVLQLTEIEVRPTVPRRGDETLTARGSVMFDHSPATLTARGRTGEAQRLLAELERQTAEDVRPEVPHLFSRLVATLREVNAEGLGGLLAAAAETPRRYLLDALPMLGTAAGMAAMRDLMLTGGATADQSDRWMTSLAMVHETRLAMVEAVAPLLAADGVRSQTLLGVSALLHRFCRGSGDCAREAAVTQTVTNVEKLLGADCTAEGKEGRTRVLAALKALGNVGLLVQGGSVLRACYEENNDIETRLAAIRAYRRMSCETIGDSRLMSTLANQQENTEVRIAAYLAVMQCPSHEVVDKLVEFLSKETLNQVGSFVWTHITNMQETNDPSKSYVKSLLYNVELSKKFNTDARKFSRYYEKTMFFESVNAGGSVEGTVIFSPESYIPRSGMLNLTVDLFGDAINILEVGVRMEGLESYIESLFGSDGLYPQEAINQALSTIRGRSSSNDISRLSDVYNKANADADSFSASTYTKIFGNELHFANYDNLNALIRSLGADDPLSVLQTLGRDTDWTENYQFLDSSYTVPTVTGLPFTLQAVGSAAVTLKTGGGFSVDSWNKMHVEGFVKPSAAMEVVSEMGVSARVARTGLKMSANLHTSTVLDGQVVIDSAKVVSVKINMPKNKVEILDVKTRFHSVHRNEERPLEMNYRNGHNRVFQYGACSQAYTADPLGIKFCSDIRYPLPTWNTPRFPFSGPLTASLTVEKTDSIDGLTFEYHHNNEDGVRKSSLMLDTPGGTQNRRVNLDYMVNIPRKAFRVGLVTPIKSLELSGGLDLLGVKKQADVQLKLDGSEVFGMSSSLTTDDSAAAVHHRPLLVIRGAAGPVFSLSGDLVVNKDKHKYTVDLTIAELFENPVVLHGSVDENNETYSISTSMTSYALAGTLAGTYRYAGNNLLIQTMTEYSLLDGPTQTIAVNTKISQDTLDAQTIYRFFMDTKLSALPFLDTELTLELVRSPGQHRGRALVLRGQHQYQLSAGIGDQDGRRSGQVAFQAEHLDVDFKLALELDMSISHQFQLNTLAQLNQDRFARGSLVVDYLSETYDFNYGIRTNITLMNSNYLLTTGVRRDEDTADFTFLASRTSSDESKAISLVSALASDDEGVHTLDVTLRLPAYPTTRLSGRLGAGVGGRYLASGELQRGRRAYRLSGEYRYTDEHVVELQARLPDRQYAGTVSARTEGGSYKVKADLRLGRRIMTVVSLRPGGEEATANFELFWNKDVDDSQSVILDVKKTTFQVSARLRYPGRDIKLLAGLTKRGVRATLELSPLKIISADGTVHVEDNGQLAASLAVRTPYPGYTDMVLTYRNKPDITDERSLLHFQVSGHIEDQEVILNGRLVAEFNGLQGIGRARGNTLKAELDLNTPFVGWERSQLFCTYFQDANDFSARVSAAKNDDVIALGVVFEKLQMREVFRINTAVDFALPVDRARKGKVGFDLALRDSEINADAVVEWTSEKVNALSMNVECSYNVTSNVWVSSLVTLRTPFEDMEKLDARLEVSKNDRILQTSFTVKRNEYEEILHTHLIAVGYKGPNSFAGEFDFACAGCPGFGATLGYQSAIEHSGFNITTYWKDQETTLRGVTRSLEEGGNEYSLTLLLPNPVRQYHIQSAFHVDLARKTLWNYWEVSRDNQTITIDLSSVWELDSKVGDSSSYTLKGVGKVTSPFLGWESARISHLGTVKMNSSKTEFSNNIQLQKENKKIVIDQSGQFHNWKSWIFEREITSNTGWFSRATELIKFNFDGPSGEAIFRATWDGQTAQLAVAEVLPDNGDYDVTLTAQWFGQPVRSLSLVVPSTPLAWTPSLTILYAPDKTIKMHGSIAHLSAASESHLAIETPFTEAILLKTSHDLKPGSKHAAVELVHGEETYNLRVEVDTNFPSEASFAVQFLSPIRFLGSNVLNINYRLASRFVMKGEVSHKNWKMSLTSDMGKNEGTAEITTPFEGLTKLSLGYAVSPKDVRVHLSRERRTISVVLADKSDSNVLKYSTQINTPYRGYELLTMTFTSPSGTQSFFIQCEQNRRNTVSMAGTYELSGPQSFVGVEIQTAFAALRNASLQFSYDLLKPTAKLLLTKNGHIEQRMQVEATADLSIASSIMSVEYQNNGLIFGPRSVAMTVTYDVQESEKRLDMQLLDDNDRFSLEGRAQLSKYSSYVTLNVGSPIPGYETISVSSKAFSSSNGPKLTFELTKNNQTIEAKFEMHSRYSGHGKAVFEMQTPFVVNRHIMLSAEYNRRSNPVRIELIAEKDEIRKTILGKIEMSYTERHTCQENTIPISLNDTRPYRCTEVTIDVLLTTPFHGLEKFVATGSVSVVDSKSQSRLVLRLGQDQVKMAARSQLGWSSSELSMEMSTPLASAQTMGLNAKYDVGSQTKMAFATLSKNDQRLEVVFNGTVQRGAAHGYVAIKTPFASSEDIRYSAMYDLNQAEKQMEISYERNGHKQILATRGFYDAESVSLNAVTPFEGFEAMGMSGSYVNNRAKREVGYEAHFNEQRHRLYVLYERDGKDNIKLRLNTPIHGMHAVEVDLRKQSFSDGVGIYLDINTDGKRSSAELRTSLGKTTMGIDIDIKSHREGFENVRLSGSVNYAKRKKAFRLASESKKQKIELSGFYALKAKGGIGKLVSKLPFPGFEKVNVKVKVTRGKKNKIVLTYTKGGKKKKITGDLTFTDTRFAINLKTPFNGFQRMSAKAGRTTAADGKVSAELSLKRSNREISVKYMYLFSLKSGDGSIEIATPYEGFEDMRMSLTYNNEARLRKMKFSARRNSREWHIESSRSWGHGTDETSLMLTSPIESIRSLKVHRSFNIKNLASMEYQSSYERNGRKFVISGKGSMTKKGKRVSLEVTVQTPLEIGQLSANVGYDFTGAPWSLNAGVSAGPRYVTFLASFGKTSGSINLKTSNPKLPTMDIDYAADISGGKQDVSANLVLADGRRLSVTYTATFSPAGSSGSVKVDSTTFGNRELKWLLSIETYQSRPQRYALNIDYKSPNVQANWDGSVLTLSSRLHRKIDATFSIVSDWYTRTIKLEASADLNNLPSLDVTADVTIDGKTYKIVIERQVRGAQRTLMVSFDGQRVKGLKIVGTSSSEPGRLGGQRSFNVTYGSGRREVTLGGLVNVGSTGKSGSVELLLKTPSAKAKEVKLKTTWSFILPNRMIKVDYSRNGVGYVATFSGSRYDKKADYTLQVSMPNIQVSRRKSISDVIVAASYDVSDGFFAKVHMEQPFEGTAEINFKKSRVETTLKSLFRLTDKLDISPKIDSHRFDLNYKNTRVRSGSQIQASLDTTAFDLGKMEVDVNVQKSSDKSTINVNYKRGLKTAQIVGEVYKAPGSGSSTFSLKAPITGFEDVSLSASYQYSPGQQYALNIDYARGGKYFRLDSSSVVSVKRVKGKLKSASAQMSIKVSSKIIKPVELVVTADTSIKDVGTPKQSGTGKFEGTLNGKKLGLTYTVDRDEHGRRIGSVVLTTPLKKPYNKIVINSDVSLHSNKAVVGVQAGPRKLSADVSWFVGEAGQYGAELSLATPYAALKTLELEARGTLNRDRSVDVFGHYQRNGKMVHVTGNVRPYAVDLTIETPTLGNFRVEGGVVVNRREKTYSVRGLVTSLARGTAAGGEVTVKAAALNDMQLTVDVHTPRSGWERFNVDLAYTAVDSPYSRVMRAAFESPQTKRVEVSLELTNRSGRGTTDLRAGLTTNYLGSAFTFWTHIFRDDSGMKYELELESPYHVNLPLLTIDH